MATSRPHQKSYAVHQMDWTFITKEASMVSAAPSTLKITVLTNVSARTRGLVVVHVPDFSVQHRKGDKNVINNQQHNGI